jgi:hypothetical protein
MRPIAPRTAAATPPSVNNVAEPSLRPEPSAASYLRYPSYRCNPRSAVKIFKLFCHAGQKLPKEISKRPKLDSHEEISEGQHNESLTGKEFLNENLYRL